MDTWPGTSWNSGGSLHLPPLAAPLPRNRPLHTPQSPACSCPSWVKLSFPPTLPREAGALGWRRQPVPGKPTTTLSPSPQCSGSLSNCGFVSNYCVHSKHRHTRREGKYTVSHGRVPESTEGAARPTPTAGRSPWATRKGAHEAEGSLPREGWGAGRTHGPERTLTVLPTDCPAWRMARLSLPPRGSPGAPRPPFNRLVRRSVRPGDESFVPLGGRPGPHPPGPSPLSLSVSSGVADLCPVHG